MKEHYFNISFKKDFSPNQHRSYLHELPSENKSEATWRLVQLRDSGTLINIGWGVRLAGTRNASMQCIRVRRLPFLHWGFDFLLDCLVMFSTTILVNICQSSVDGSSVLIFSWCLLIFYLYVCLSFIGQWLIVANNSWDHIQFTRNTE